MVIKLNEEQRNIFEEAIARRLNLEWAFRCYITKHYPESYKEAAKGARQKSHDPMLYPYTQARHYAACLGLYPFEHFKPCSRCTKDQLCEGFHGKANQEIGDRRHRLMDYREQVMKYLRAKHKLDYHTIVLLG